MAKKVSKKSQEVSNKTLLILIVAVAVVTVVSTWFIVSAAFDARVPVNEVHLAQGEVNLEIASPEEEEVEPAIPQEDSTSGEASLTIEE